MIDDANWIEWGGGECPVEPGTLVDLRWKTTGSTSPRHRAETLDWRHFGCVGDIGGYRVVKP